MICASKVKNKCLRLGYCFQPLQKINIYMFRKLDKYEPDLIYTTNKILLKNFEKNQYLQKFGSVDILKLKK